MANVYTLLTFRGSVFMCSLYETRYTSISLDKKYGVMLICRLRGVYAAMY